MSPEVVREAASVVEANLEGGLGKVLGSNGGTSVGGEGPEAEARVPGVDAGGMHQILRFGVGRRRYGGGDRKEEEEKENGRERYLHCNFLERCENGRDGGNGV